MALKRIVCAACGSNKFDHNEDGDLVCAFCSAKFDSPREPIFCPTCNEENLPEARRCMNCGHKFGLRCTSCNHLNEPGIDHCSNCATPLDMVETIFSRAAGTPARVAKEVLIESKRANEVYMKKERERLNAEEQERRKRLLAQQEASKKEQSRIIWIALGGMGLLGLCFAAFVILFT